MLRTYYHATPYENLLSILAGGILRGADGVVYLTEKQDEAARFLLARGCRDILSIGVLIDDEKVEETFDHNQSFFKCRAFGYFEDINQVDMISFFRYEL